MPITPLPTPAPSRNQSENDFVANSNALFGALPTLVTEINAESALIDADRVAAAASASSAAGQVTLAAAQVTLAAAEADRAEAAADIASGAANFQGEYSAGTTYQIGQSVSYLGTVFIAKTVNLGVTPVNGANWLELGGGGGAALLACIVDEKSSGTSGGTSTTSYSTRTLNTVAFDPDSIVTLSSNTFASDVDCGVTWSAPGVAGGSAAAHKTRLVRVSDNSVIAVGSVDRAFGGGRSVGSARILAGVAYRIEQQAGSAETNGFGFAASFGDPEIYTIVNLWS